MRVTVEQIRDILRRRRDGVRTEHLPRNGSVRRPGKRNRRQIIFHPETFLKSQPQGMLSGPPGQQQSPVDIEKKKFFHSSHPEKIAAGTP